MPPADSTQLAAPSGMASDEEGRLAQSPLPFSWDNPQSVADWWWGQLWRVILPSEPLQAQLKSFSDYTVSHLLPLSDPASSPQVLTQVLADKCPEYSSLTQGQLPGKLNRSHTVIIPIPKMFPSPRALTPTAASHLSFQTPSSLYSPRPLFPVSPARPSGPALW